jgi:hypothetical protein
MAMSFSEEVHLAEELAKEFGLRDEKQETTEEPQEGE